MKRFLSLIAMSIFTLSASAMPQAVCSGKWIKHCGAGEIPSIDSNMSVTLDGTTVFGHTNVKGRLQSFKAHLNNVSIKGTASLAKTLVQHNVKAQGSLSLYDTLVVGDVSVQGSTTISKSTIRGTGEFAGTFNADNSIFDGPIHVSAATITFIHTQAKDVYVGKAFSMVPFYHPKIHIDDKSNVTGTIIFPKGKEGVVYVSAGSHFSGKVVNGVAYFEKTNA